MLKHYKHKMVLAVRKVIDKIKYMITQKLFVALSRYSSAG